MSHTVSHTSPHTVWSTVGNTPSHTGSGSHTLSRSSTAEHCYCCSPFLNRKNSKYIVGGSLCPRYFWSQIIPNTVLAQDFFVVFGDLSYHDTAKVTTYTSTSFTYQSSSESGVSKTSQKDFVLANKVNLRNC